MLGMFGLYNYILCESPLHDCFNVLFFRLEKEDGPAHERKFTYSVQVETDGGTFVTIGDPMSKVKDAENSGAQKMLEVLLKL